MANRQEKHSWKSVVALIAISATFSMALLETALYFPFFDDRFKSFFRVPPVSLENFQEEASAFFHSKRFNAELGWDNRPPVSNHVVGKAYFAQAYGDSFVQSGHESITWEAAFENITGKAILNFGQGGYSLGQAELKFEKYSAQYPTPVAILGLYVQMYRRDLSYYSRYYFNSPNWKFAFKPIFVKEGEKYKLYRPPCSDESCMWEVLHNSDSEAMRILATHDYWYRTNMGKPEIRFPRTLSYVQALPTIWKSRNSQSEINDYFVIDDSLELTKYLVKRFAAYADKSGMVPVCLMLYSSHDLVVMKSGPRWDKDLLDFLKEEQIRYVDTGTYILQHYSAEDDFKSIRVPDGHLNDRGDQMVASALAQGLVEMKLIENGNHPEN